MAERSWVDHCSSWYVTSKQRC